MSRGLRLLNQRLQLSIRSAFSRLQSGEHAVLQAELHAQIRGVEVGAFMFRQILLRETQTFFHGLHFKL